MNEFNPFETLGIDPNESMPSRTPLDTQTQVNPIETAGQFNPFEELNINVNGFPQPTANGKDTEVSSMLGINQFTPMTDDEKQSYVDALSDEDWNTWNQLKSEGYSFEARKALMENQDMLYDISTPGTGKYLQSQLKEPITSEGVQRYIDWYQDRAAGFGERVSDKLMEKALYKKDGTERESKLVKGIGGMAAHILGKATELLDDAMNLGGHQMELLNNLQVIRGKKDPSERAEFDRTQENYKSPVASGTSIISNSLGLGLDIAYFVPGLVLNTLAQGDGPIARVINGAGELISGIPNLTVDMVANAMMKDPQVEAFIKDPANEGMLDDIKEGLTYAGMLIMGKYLKSKKGALGETKAGMMMNQFRTRFGESLRSAVEKGKQGGERAKGFNEAEGIEGTAAGRSNVRRATIEGLKQGRKERWNQETPIEEQPGLPDTRITPYEEKPGLSTEVKNEVKPTPTKTNTDLAKIAEETKLSENNINNLKSNPDLQTEFRNKIKPYLEANGKSNPEGVISEPVNDLVYDIKSGIDELKVQQANLNRSINNKKLTPVEKALIKEIEKIINKKEPKQIYNGLKKLTPEQLGLLERTVPNLEQRIQTIGQMLDLTMEITKNDLVGRFLKFQAERPRKGITGFAKKLLYDYVKDLYDQKGIQSSTESIDKFIDSLSDQQKSDIVKTIENSNGELSDSVKKSLSDIVNEMEVEGEPTEIRRLSENEKTEDIKRNRAQLEDEGYTPETRLYTVDKNGKLVSHETSKELEIKPFGSDKQLKDIFKTAGVNLTIPSELIFKIRYAKDADGVYIGDKDLIAVPGKSVAVGVLAHEFGHRVMSQLTENEKLKVIEDIKKKNYGMTDKAAEERFAEYFRNYFLYGNINGVTALETFTTAVGQKAGQRIVNIMEKTKMDLFADLGANSEIDMYQKTKSIDKMIDSIYKLKEKGTEIITRETEQGSKALAEEEAARNVGTLEKFDKSDLPTVDSAGNSVSKGMNDYMRNSQVRNENGDLILVGHGTKENFDIWNPNTVGVNTQNLGRFGKGLYFTDDLNVAKGYTETGLSGPNPHVEKGYLNITNMLDWNKGYSIEEFKDFANDLGLDPEQIAHYTDNKNGKIYLLNGQDLKFMEEYGELDWEEQGFKDLVYDENTLDLGELTDYLRDAGYDGAKGDNGEYTEYVIFDNSNQFKRIDNKNPTSNSNFSLNKSDIPNQDVLDLIKKETNELSDIKINEDGFVVGKYHGHETPIYSYIEDSNLPTDLKEFLKKQEIEYLKEQDKVVLDRLNKLNGN